jgi:AP endonuclease 2
VPRNNALFENSLFTSITSGYSGVAIYTRNAKCAAIRAEEGLTGVLCPPNSTTKFRDLPPDQQIGGYPKPGQLDSTIDEVTLDSEGRCVILEFPAFVLIGVYSPATRNETRTDYRIAFINAMDARVRNLIAMGKQVILTGDLNIIRDEIDSAGLMDTLRKEEMTLEDFMTMPSRRFFNQLIFGGRVFGERDEDREEPVMWDICREFHPERKGMYTCWETKKNARPGNFGSRIDYVVCSDGLKDWFIDSNIQEGLLGSDHCPVYGTFGDVVKANGKDVHIEDVMNPSGMFKDGERLREWSPKDLLPQSAKLIPEFDRRRNIKDMFFKKGAPSSSTASTATAAEKELKPDEDAILVVDSQTSIPESSISTWDLSESTPDQFGPATSTQSTEFPRKREASPGKATSRPMKKPKASLSKESSKSGLAQSSLTGFFKPKQTASPKKPDGISNDVQTADRQGKSPATIMAVRIDSTGGKEKGANRNGKMEMLDDDTQALLTEAQNDGKVFDPIENKESWSKLLGKRIPPRCEHNEPCISLLTKKAGINCGE